MIRVENCTCGYGGDDPVLHQLSFRIAEGERVGLIGANGAGKSTIMKCMVGLLSAEGTVCIAGREVCRKELPWIRRQIGYVLQDSDNQMFMATVKQDMIFGPMNYGMSAAEAEKLAKQTLEQLGMEFLWDRQNHRLSGGEKRMAALATILTMNPRILLMDEPSLALDPGNRRRLIQVVNHLPQTKLIASHDLDLVWETCDRVLLIHDGRLAADGPTEAILQDRELLEENRLELPLCLAGVPSRTNFE